MIQAFGAFAKPLLASGGFNVSEFPKKAYRELLTGFEQLQEEQLVILPGMIELAKAYPGYLAVDDTKNPKYGLKHLAKKLKILTNGATRTGYEIVLLLRIVPGMGRFPLGFAVSNIAKHPLGGSMRAQGIFVAGCLLLYSHLEIVSGGKPYAALASVISGDLKPETLIAEGFVMLP